MPDHNQSAPASTSLIRQLTRGAIGFGLIGSALALTPSAGPTALLLATPGMIALHGCPMCWIAGLIQTISAGQLKRTCANDNCTLHLGSDGTDVTAPPPHRSEDALSR